MLILPGKTSSWSGGGGGGVSKTFVSVEELSAPFSTTHTLSSVGLGSSANGDLMLMFTRMNSSETISSVTADGNSLSLVASYTNGTQGVFCYSGAVSGSTGDIVITTGTSALAYYGFGIYRLDNYSYLADAGNLFVSSGTLNLNSETGGVILLGAVDYDLTALGLTGPTLDGAVDDGSTLRAEFASEDVVSGATPDSVGITGANYVSALAVSFGAP